MEGIEAGWNLEYLLCMTEIIEEDFWQLIETAPRDGTKILLFGNPASSEGSEGPLVTIGYYFAGFDCWMTEGGVVYDAILWMPLPKLAEKQPAKQRTKRKTVNRVPLKKLSHAVGVERLRSKI